MTVELLFTQSIRGDEYRSSFFTLQHGGRDAVGCLVPGIRRTPEDWLVLREPPERALSAPGAR
jgi:hypothetical protein